ncbi:uncharacterized protein LOC122809196 [Protopterus annectens]|uniref:uncharacterized protein LOC122809196 n=1 Tax=Protopterus annectens TaxID=7888 RepID=UPI001CF97B42|nr:uncharacterized protein LOC122809196 [Protopterus annectens]
MPSFSENCLCPRSGNKELCMSECTEQQKISGFSQCVQESMDDRTEVSKNTIIACSVEETGDRHLYEEPSFSNNDIFKSSKLVTICEEKVPIQESCASTSAHYSSVFVFEEGQKADNYNEMTTHQDDVISQDPCMHLQPDSLYCNDFIQFDAQKFALQNNIFHPEPYILDCNQPIDLGNKISGHSEKGTQCNLQNRVNVKKLKKNSGESVNLLNVNKENETKFLSTSYTKQTTENFTKPVPVTYNDCFGKDVNTRSSTADTCIPSDSNVKRKDKKSPLRYPLPSSSMQETNTSVMKKNYQGMKLQNHANPATYESSKEIIYQTTEIYSRNMRERKRKGHSRHVHPGGNLDGDKDCKTRQCQTDLSNVKENVKDKRRAKKNKFMASKRGTNKAAALSPEVCYKSRSKSLAISQIWKKKPVMGVLINLLHVVKHISFCFKSRLNALLLIYCIVTVLGSSFAECQHMKSSLITMAEKAQTACSGHSAEVQFPILDNMTGLVTVKQNLKVILHMNTSNITKCVQHSVFAKNYSFCERNKSLYVLKIPSASEQHNVTFRLEYGISSQTHQKLHLIECKGISTTALPNDSAVPSSLQDFYQNVNATTTPDAKRLHIAAFILPLLVIICLIYYCCRARQFISKTLQRCLFHIPSSPRVQNRPAANESTGNGHTPIFLLEEQQMNPDASTTNGYISESQSSSSHCPFKKKLMKFSSYKQSSGADRSVV